jgi:hypothetical protein
MAHSRLDDAMACHLTPNTTCDPSASLFFPSFFFFLQIAKYSKDEIFFRGPREKVT